MLTTVCAGGLVPRLVPDRVDGVGPSCAVFFFRCHFARSSAAAFVVGLAVVVGGCGGGLGVGVDALDVTLTKTVECSQTGLATRNCVDAAVLGQQTISGRWIVETGSDNTSLVLTLQDGRTLTGLGFPDDGRLLSTSECAGDGGRCLFARRRESSIDINSGCQTFDELFVVGRFDPETPEDFVGTFNSIVGADAACGTASSTERGFSVAGVIVEQPVRALQEAQ